MKLYYSPGACSLSPHIVLREAGIAFEPVLANMRTHQLADGSDYYNINAKGYVPVLELDNGERLTEGPAIVQYIADLAPASKLAPAAGTMQRYRLMEWLGFINSEVHKTYSPLFNPAIVAESKAVFSKRLLDRFTWIDSQLAGKHYLLGEDFSVADAYLFTVVRWAPAVKLDLSGLANLSAFMARVQARPAVQAALKAEG